MCLVMALWIWQAIKKCSDSNLRRQIFVISAIQNEVYSQVREIKKINSNDKKIKRDKSISRKS